MNIAIRVDASFESGTGHLVRCLTLADALKQHGANIRFISRHIPEHMRDLIATRGHDFASLTDTTGTTGSDNLEHASWLGSTQVADAQESIRVLSDRAWDWLVVDHYALNVQWESALRRTAKSILAIDDIADRQHDCDLLLDPNFYSDMDIRYAGKVPAHCRQLLGPRYVLLRKEFADMHRTVKIRTGPVRRILVFFGGIDAPNHTGGTLEVLSKFTVNELKVDVVVGASHPKLQDIRTKCEAHDFDLHVQTDRMAALMASADLAIGAGGSAIWERCCLGLPTLVFSTAKNQAKQVADVANAGWVYAPEPQDDLNKAIALHLQALLENNALRTVISRGAAQAVDGHGVLRVMECLGFNDVKIRRVRPEDLQKLFEWRNHQSVRIASRTTAIIDWQEHQKWFADVLKSADRSLLIGIREDSPVGVVRFDMQGSVAEVSIYLVPGVKEAGLGRRLLHSAEHWLAANHPEIQRVRAHVLNDNDRSRHLFLGADYKMESATYVKGLH